MNGAELADAFDDESLSFEQQLELARSFVGQVRPCSLCERAVAFGKLTCNDCVALLEWAARATQLARSGRWCRYAILYPDGRTAPSPQPVSSLADSVCVDLLGTLHLQLRAAARLRRPEVLARTRAERMAS